MKLWIINKLLVRLSPEEKNAILTQAVEDLFNSIGVEDILTDKDGEWWFMDKPMSEVNKQTIMVEAQTFIRTKLWKVLQADIKYQANKKMFIKSQDSMDLLAGKLWLYTLDVIKTRLENTVKADALKGFKK